MIPTSVWANCAGPNGHAKNGELLLAPLRWRWSFADVHVDAADTHGLERLEALLGLCADGAIGIEFDRLLIRLNRAGLHHGSHFFALGLELHRVNQSNPEKQPGLRVLGINLYCLLQGFDG